MHGLYSTRSSEVEKNELPMGKAGTDSDTALGILRQENNLRLNNLSWPSSDPGEAATQQGAANVGAKIGKKERSLNEKRSQEPKRLCIEKQGLACQKDKADLGQKDALEILNHGGKRKVVSKVGN